MTYPEAWLASGIATMALGELLIVRGWLPRAAFLLRLHAALILVRLLFAFVRAAP